MNKEQLMKRIEAAVDAAMRGRMYGNIEIEFQCGTPMWIRKTEKEKLTTNETPRGANYHGAQAKETR
jgi:hypothetical protein